MKKNLLAASLLITLFLVPLFVSAAIVNIWEGTGGKTASTTCNIRPYTCTICDAAVVTVNIIRLLLTLGIIIAVVIVLYGAVRLMIAGGSQTAIGEAKNIIKDALIGLLIVSLAWVIVSTIFKTFTTKVDWNKLDFIGCQDGKLPYKEGDAGNENEEGNP